VLAIVLVVTGVAATGLLHPSPAGATADPQGVDVAAEGAISWAAVAGAGDSFAYVNATEGNYYTDDDFQTYWDGMVSAGMTPGASMLVDPTISGVQQADYFFDAVGPDYRAGDLLPAIDTSLIGEDVVPSCADPGQRFPVACVSSATALSVLGAVVSTLKSDFGVAPVIYTYASLWNGPLGDPTGYGDDPLWDAQFGSIAPTSTSVPDDDWYGNGWTLWQSSDSGTVPGIPGGTDLDQANGADLPTLAEDLPLSFVTTSLPSGQIGDTYDYTLAAQGGNAPYTWKLVKDSGKLPKGLKLDRTSGVIFGNPTKAGSSTFTIEVLDTKTKTKPKTQNTTTASFTITVAPAA
jgi:GH25 family lysozyme M1 (1,4-beta-N-acetylmuramidase)